MDNRDIFIAYHGTYEAAGSLEKAKELFYFLESRGIKCYFFPSEKSGYFAETPIAVKKSKKFILICNQNIKRNNDGSVSNNGIVQELQTFWNCIYEGKRKRGDARVFCYNGLTSMQANELHIAFQGVAHFDENILPIEKCYEAVYQWILSDEIETNSIVHQSTTNNTPPIIGTTNELERVFLRRSYMNKVWDISRMLLVARKIECLGISNNEMTLNMDEETLKTAIVNNLNLELLFLNPNSKHTKNREKEEGQQKNTIKNNTNTTLSFIMRLKRILPADCKDNLSIYIYDQIPRLNMIFIDEEHLLLQYYANAIPGASNPCFYIKKKEDNQLFDFYHQQYQKIREGSTQQ